MISQAERLKQTTDHRHPLYSRNPPNQRLTSRRSFLSTVGTIKSSCETAQRQLWNEHLKSALANRTEIVMEAENLPSGKDEDRSTWVSLNRFRVRVGSTKAARKKWRYYQGEVTCACGEVDEDISHMRQCRLNRVSVTEDDLRVFNDKVKIFVEQWRDAV